LIFVGHLITGMLHGISNSDPLTLVAAGITLIVVAFLAALFPAWRAATLDPMQALRVEH
jgi:ABC-type antimicrobial peptide transport system permease subunit